MVPMRALTLAFAALCLAACSTFQAAPKTDVFVVFFEGQTVELTPEAKTIIASAAAAGKKPGVSVVTIAGPSTKIAPGYDPGLASPRIDLVQRELMADGITADRRAQASLTTDDVKVPTSGAQRVEIRIGH
jgi:hypothetical protein